MNELLQKFRAQYPEYDDMSDGDLAKALHAKFYDDMPYQEFAKRVGLEHRGQFEDMSRKEFTNGLADSYLLGMGGKGLGEAVKAIRGLRAAQAAAKAPMIPSPSGLLTASGSPVMARAPIVQKSAMDALRTFVGSPLARRAAQAAGLGAPIAAWEMAKRVF